VEDLFHWEFFLSIIAVIFLTSGLVYTMRIAKRQRYQGEYDDEISEKIQAHPIIRNPVFLAYIIGLGLALAYMVYVALSSN
jgi:predicted permease